MKKILLILNIKDIIKIIINLNLILKKAKQIVIAKQKIGGNQRKIIMK